MKAKKTFLNLLAVLIIPASHIAFATDAQPTNNFYNQEKTNILVTANHPEFTIQLKSNPTTGYAWFLRNYDANLISPTKHHFERPEQKLMGAPGYEVWTFRVKPAAFSVPHQTTIRLIYARPWEGAEGSTQVTFRITTKKE